MDRKVKLILLLLNKRGIEVNHETVSQYSEKFDTMITRHALVFWYIGYKEIKGNKESFPYAKRIQFKNMISMIKYLVAVKDNKAQAGEYNAEEE